ncbi:unnamed protein product, partial [Iphiclides podalirius]
MVIAGSSWYGGVGFGPQFVVFGRSGVVVSLCCTRRRPTSAPIEPTVFPLCEREGGLAPSFAYNGGGTPREVPCGLAAQFGHWPLAPRAAPDVLNSRERSLSAADRAPWTGRLGNLKS